MYVIQLSMCIDLEIDVCDSTVYVYWSGDWCMWFIGFSTDFPSGDSDTGLNEEIVAFFCQCPTPTAHDPID